MHRGRRETRRIARTKVILARLVRGGVCFSALRRKRRLRLLRAARDGSALVRAGERVRERPAILELAPQSTHLLAVERDHGGGDARRGGRDVVDASRRVVRTRIGKGRVRRIRIRRIRIGARPFKRPFKSIATRRVVRAAHRPRQGPRERRRQLRLRVIPQRRGLLFVVRAAARERRPPRLRTAPGGERRVHERERRAEPRAKRLALFFFRDARVRVVVVVAAADAPCSFETRPVFSRRFLARRYAFRKKEERNRLRRPGVAHGGFVEPTRREARDGGVHAVLRVQQRVPRVVARVARAARVLGGGVQQAPHARPVVPLPARGVGRHRRGQLRGIAHQQAPLGLPRQRHDELALQRLRRLVHDKRVEVVGARQNRLAAG